jgi:hypothetical protein
LGSSGNVTALDVLRTIAKEPETLERVLAEIRMAGDPRLEQFIAGIHADFQEDGAAPSLLIQRASPALFGTENLLFGQIDLTHHHVARLHHLRVTGDGKVISYEFHRAVFCGRQQVDALCIV